MFDEDLRRRVRRLADGDFRVDDLDRLFLGRRARAGGNQCFREIGDFVAHRDSREKGLVTQVARDVFTSVDVWSMSLRGLTPSKPDFLRAARANFRLASDEQLLKGCGYRRAVVQTKLERALKRIERGQSLPSDESRVLTYLGNRFIWRPAFTGHQLFEEFKSVLSETGLIDEAGLPALNNTKEFVCLYALALMHGTSISLEDGKKATLFSGFANAGGKLETKIELIFRELNKPIFSPICLFVTDIDPTGHCEPELIPPDRPVLPNHWEGPIEVGGSGRLSFIRG